MILILVEDYPSNSNKYAMSYVHSRNLYYKKLGINLKVLSFKAKECYIYEGIEVITLNKYMNNNKEKLEIVISHAPNLKNHLRFLISNLSKINKIIFVFHAHEALKTKNYYPKPYSFNKEKKFKSIIQNFYDYLKLPILKLFILKMLKLKKITLFFVSNWMKLEFERNLKLTLTKNDSYHIIHNNSHPSFVKFNYGDYVEENYNGDFITIRPLDNPKYGIDIVRELAIKYPNLSFHVYGKGEFFEHYDKPANITVIKEFYNHEALIEILPKYKAALMPTRLDAQGVMMCEMATFGMPVITSNINICREMLEGFNNIYYLDNENLDIDLNMILEKINIDNSKCLKFSSDNTVKKEAEIITNLMN